MFNVVLVPNPALSRNQQVVIAQDFSMRGGTVSVSVRKAFLYYFQKRLRLDAVSALDGPHETPLVIANREEFDNPERFRCHVRLDALAPTPPCC